MRHRLAIVWILVVCGGLYLYFFHASFLQGQLERAFRVSIYTGYAFFLLLVCVRAFTLIPSTYLIFIGLLFFRPVPLYVLTMIGAVVSSISVYYFSRLLHFDELLERKYPGEVAKIRSLLQKNQLPIITGWAASPFLPTDVICYVCGTLRVNPAKFVLGIIVGEGITSGLYIFFGHYVLQYLHIAL